MSEQPAPTKPAARPTRVPKPARPGKDNGADEPPPPTVAWDASVPGPIGALFPLEVVDVIVTLPNPNPVLVLRTKDEPYRTISIPIGVAEGTSIANALRKVATPKPLTHELFAETLTLLGAAIAVARITAVEGGAFYAEIVLGAPSGQHTIACRPSDAVAMALRQVPPAPIVAVSSVIDAAGVGAGDTER